MHSILQALGQPHIAYAYTKPAEREQGAKPAQVESIVEISTYDFPCVVWIEACEVNPQQLVVQSWR